MWCYVLIIIIYILLLEWAINSRVMWSCLGFYWGQRGIMRSDRYVVNDSNFEVALLLFYRPIAQRNSVFSYSHFLSKPSVFCV